MAQSGPSKDRQLNPIDQIVTTLVELEKRVTALETQQQVTLIVRTVTGDPITGKTGQAIINTVDNTLKWWADGGWRELATW